MNLRNCFICGKPHKGNCSEKDLESIKKIEEELRKKGLHPGKC